MCIWKLSFPLRIIATITQVSEQRLVVSAGGAFSMPGSKSLPGFYFLRSFQCLTRDTIILYDIAALPFFWVGCFLKSGPMEAFYKNICQYVCWKVPIYTISNNQHSWEIIVMPSGLFYNIYSEGIGDWSYWLFQKNPENEYGS